MDGSDAGAGHGARDPLRDSAVARDFRRNAAAIVGFDLFWCIGSPFVLLFSVVPSYLLFLGASKTLLQAVTIGMTLTCFLQLLSGRAFHGPGRKWVQLAVWALFAGSWFTYGALALLWFDAVPRWVWIGLFTAHSFLLMAINNIASPSWQELVLQNTPLARRGLLYSLRYAAIGAAGFLGTYLASLAMSRWGSPANYHAAFMIGALLMAVSCASVVFIRDHHGPAAPRPPPLDLRAAARDLLGNFNFRVFLVFQIMVAAALGFAPLLLAYGRDVLGMAPEDTIKFTLGYFIGSIAFGSLIPRLADRVGFRLVAICSAALLAGAFIVILARPDSRLVLLGGYVLLNGAMTLSNIAAVNLGVELAPRVKITTILAAIAILALPVNLWLAPLGGWLADHFGAAGYMMVFASGATLSLCALAGFAIVIREPRTGQELFVRMRDG